MNPKSKKNKKNKNKQDSDANNLEDVSKNLEDLKNSDMFKKLFELTKTDTNEEILKKIQEMKPLTHDIGLINERVNKIIDEIDKTCEKSLQHNFEDLNLTTESSKPESKKNELPKDPELEKRKIELIKSFDAKVALTNKKIETFESCLNEVPDSSIIHKRKDQILALLEFEKQSNQNYVNMILN